MFALVESPLSVERQDDGLVGGLTGGWQCRSGQGDRALDLVGVLVITEFESEGFEQSPSGVFG
ncbi:hypothetical protein HFP15_18680 [Amycolatopsis sp. K13G38]|uniref:Uncharacterized protein n=1 Tax=Amycolatopsis acididurans TaxID=2724524 RepID=A0ABX1J5F8_9PSEU|nr:hypothetical protein [Amycolatopsis acididurans]NKQ54914.1 hypothetical protein [Amycolatopsis acididurans]